MSGLRVRVEKHFMSVPHEANKPARPRCNTTMETAGSMLNS